MLEGLDLLVLPVCVSACDTVVRGAAVAPSSFCSAFIHSNCALLPFHVCGKMSVIGLPWSDWCAWSGWGALEPAASWSRRTRFSLCVTVFESSTFQCAPLMVMCLRSQLVRVVVGPVFVEVEADAVDAGEAFDIRFLAEVWFELSDGEAVLDFLLRMSLRVIDHALQKVE